MSPDTLLVISTVLPLAGFVFVILFGSRFAKPDQPAWLTVGVMGLSFLCAVFALVRFVGGDMEPICDPWPWIPVGGGQYLEIGPYVDHVTVILFAMITLVSLLVHVYSIGYMAGDPRKSRFMAYMQLFTFSMLGIVLGNSLLQLFIFWELVGISSYLLIGFWYEKRGPQLACKKAFVMNRIGDMGFLIGMGILFYQFGGDFILRAAEPGLGIFGTLVEGRGIDPLDAGEDGWWLTLAGIGLFMGAMGKSAQFPLQTWLPDAMEGPTPVSSIVHSATMVAAGVYLTARIFPLLTPEAHLFIATIGLVTLVMAALIACVQTDIKKVLAYSTLSQLGYMVLGLGAGSYVYPLFHLVTHAFFKCCLFQCSGSVIHAAHHEQEMTRYGGLLKKMPLTGLAFGISTLAIAGAAIPFTKIALSGFYSKDGIIASAVNYGDVLAEAGMGWGLAFWWGPLIIAYVTPFYMARAFVLTFLGKPRDRHLHDHAHEVPWTMFLPQLILAVLAIGAGWKFFGIAAGIKETMPPQSQPAGEAYLEHGYHMVHVGLLHGIGWILAVGAAVLLYLPGFTITSRIVAIPGIRQVHWWLYNKMGFDGLYDIVTVGLFKLLSGILAWFDRVVVDGAVNLVGRASKAVGYVVGGFDNRFVDGTVRGSGRTAVQMGAVLHRTQSGNIRTYVLLLVTGILAGLLLVVPFALGWFRLGLPAG